MTHYLGFILFIGLAWGLYFFQHYIVFRPLQRVLHLESNFWVWGLVFLSLSYFLAAFGERFFPNTFTRFFYMAASIWVGIVFLLFSVFFVYEILHFFLQKDSKNIIFFLFGLVIILSLYSLLNAREIVIKKVRAPIKNLAAPVKIVQLSDIHIGTINKQKFLDRIIRKTGAQKPDMILITGDLFDGSGPVDQTMLDPFKKLSAPTYFSLGNHEVYEGTHKVEKALSPFPLTILRNKKVEYQGIQIIGVDDPQGRSQDFKLIRFLENMALDPKKPSLLMNHTPNEWNIARKFGIDLQLSGHTHNGQIFPFTLIVKIFSPYIYGLYEKNGRFLYTSSGVGTWGPPMRLVSRNEIVVIELIPQKQEIKKSESD